MATDIANSDQFNAKGAFFLGLLIIAIVLLFIAISVWFVITLHGDYSNFLANRFPIVIEQDGHTVFYLAPLAFLGLLVLGLACVTVGVRGRPYPPSASEKLNRVVGQLVIVGLAGMFAGSYVANKLWAESFRNHGYNECPGSFTITKKWFTTVWVDDPGLCYDEEIRQMFRDFERAPEINEFILNRRQ